MPLGQLQDLVPYYLKHADLVCRVELENGFAHEMRICWNDRNNYVFVYTFIHAVMMG